MENQLLLTDILNTLLPVNTTHYRTFSFLHHQYYYL